MEVCHVLIVEDDPDLRVMVVTVLNNHGFTVHQAADTTSALREIEESHPRVILLDAHVPGQLQQIGQALRERQSASAIIAMTAAPEKFLELTGIQPAAYLTKPFTLGDLAEVVKRYCSRARRQAA